MTKSREPPRLERVTRFDSIALKRNWTPEGFLLDTPILTTVGIFEYRNPDGTIRRELRLPKYVFDKESLASYEGKPVIITHDAERITTANVDAEIVGTVLTPGYREGDNVRAKVVIHDVDEVKRSGYRELSLGYDLELLEEAGEYQGEPYDAIQTNMKINHLALVSDARAGSSARLNLDARTAMTQVSMSPLIDAPNPQPTTEGGNQMPKKRNQRRKDGKQRATTIEAFRKRRQRRLDEAEEEEKNPRPPVDTGDKDETRCDIEEKLDDIKKRRVDRDNDGDPVEPDDAMSVISQYDDDIECLLEIIDILTAREDFDDSQGEDPDVGTKVVSKQNKNQVDVDEEPEYETDEDDEYELDGDKKYEKDYDDPDEYELDEDEDKDYPSALDEELESSYPPSREKSNADSVDRIVRERLAIALAGNSLGLNGLERMRPMDAKRAVIKKMNPKLRLDGKSRAYINAAFDMAVQSIGKSSRSTDGQRRQMTRRLDGYEPTGRTRADQSRERMIQRQYNPENGGKK